MADRKDDPFAAIEAHHREQIRFKATEVEISSNRVLGGAETVDEIARRNGYASAGDFWRDALAGPLRAESYVFLLRKYHPTLDAPDPTRLERALRAVLRRAIRASLSWITDGPEGWTVDPEAATRWIISLRTEAALIPEELRDFIEGRAPPATPAATGKRKAGRPIEHDWGGAREFARRHFAEHPLPPRKARAIELIAEWFIKNDGPKAPNKRDIDRNVVDELYAGK